MSSKGMAASRQSWWSQALHNRPIALVLAMIVIIPLVASPAGYLLGVTPAPAVVLEGFTLLLVIVLLWNARWDISREWFVTFLRTAANLPILLLMALVLVSCAILAPQAFAVQGTLQLAAGVLLYFVVAYQFRQSKHLFMLVDTLLFLAAAISVVTMGQYTMNPEARGTSLYGNAQPLGSLLMILLPIIAAVALADKTPSRKLTAQAITVMTAGSLLLAQTRSGWLGAIAGLFVLGLLSMLSPPGQRPASGSRSLTAHKHKLVLPLLLAIVCAGFLLVVATQNSTIVRRASTLSNISQVQSLKDRQKLWRGALEMIQQRPLMGWGIGQYPVEQYEFTGVGFKIREGVPASLAENAHNFYLQTAVELGLPGLLLMLAVLGTFLVSAARRLPQMDPGIRRTLLLGSIASVVAFSVDALGSPSWQYGQVSMFLWLILGVGASCLRPRT